MRKTSSRPRFKTKPQTKLAKKREPRTNIISFRLRDTEAKLLAADLKQHPVAGIKSLKQFARKLTIDYARERLVYVENIDRQIDPDARERLQIETPNCQMSDHRFLKALRGFLSVEENWRKLRLFMLRAGWPEDSTVAYNSSTSEQERLMIAQKVLTKMLK